MAREGAEGSNRYRVTVTGTTKREEMCMPDTEGSREREKHLHHATNSKYVERFYRSTERPVPHSAGTG